MALTVTGGAITPITVTTKAQGYYGVSSVPVVAGLTNYTVTPTLFGGAFILASAGASVSTTVNANGVDFTQN